MKEFSGWEWRARDSAFAEGRSARLLRAGLRLLLAGLSAALAAGAAAAAGVPPPVAVGLGVGLAGAVSWTTHPRGER